MYRWSILIGLLLMTKLINGQSIRQLDSNRYWAGVPAIELNLMQARSVNGGKQLQSRWCWAACIQIIMNYHGIAARQEDLVQHLYGTKWVNKGADEIQILEAIHRWALATHGYPVQVLAKGGLQSAETIIRSLAYKWPLIVGLSKADDHHAVVLTSIEYRVTPDGFRPLTVSLFDPWPTAPTHRIISWSDFQSQCSAAIQIKLVR